MIRAAFTMIELIFAIVIISITALSLPMMMHVSQNSAESSVSQEAIYAAASVMLDVLSHPWDENTINPNAAQSFERVVRIPGGTARYDVNTSSYRSGHIRQDLHRRFHEDNTSAFFNRATASTNAAITGMEELSANNIALTGLLGRDSYKEMTQYSIAVNDISDVPATPFVFSQTASGTASNMRMIRVAMQRADNTDIVVLYGYAANIGEVDFYSRVY